MINPDHRDIVTRFITRHYKGADLLPYQLMQSSAGARWFEGHANQMSATSAGWAGRSGEAAEQARAIGIALAACCARAGRYAAIPRRCRNYASEVLRLCA